MNTSVLPVLYLVMFNVFSGRTIWIPIQSRNSSSLSWKGNKSISKECKTSKQEWWLSRPGFALTILGVTRTILNGRSYFALNTSFYIPILRKKKLFTNIKSPQPVSLFQRHSAWRRGQGRCSKQMVILPVLRSLSFFFSWWTQADNKSLSPAVKHAGIWIRRLAFSWRMTGMKFLIWAHRRAWSSLRQFISQQSDGQAGSPARLGPTCLRHWSPVPRRDGSPASWLLCPACARNKRQESSPPAASSFQRPGQDAHLPASSPGALETPAAAPRKGPGQEAPS